MNTKPVAVLCAARNSIYHAMDDVDVYDVTRDARSFSGGMPVVAHPPCRAWSAFCAHQAKPEAGEKELGIWCCEMLRTCGGVLEQPAHSRLFAAGGLPLPGDGVKGGVWSLQVDQFWWGLDWKKGTWLAFSGVPRESVVMPLRLHDGRSDKAIWNSKSKGQRARTIPAFGQWMVNAARMSLQCEC